MAEGESGALRSLLAFFRIEVDSKDLKKADGAIGEFIEKVDKVISGGVLAEVARKNAEFFKGQVENAAHLQDVSEKLNIGVDQLKAFGFAAKSAGVDFDSAAFMLGRLQRSLGGAGKGGKGTADELKKLGINSKEAAKKDTIEVMLELADAFKKMPTQAQKTAEAVKLFGRSGIAMVPILSKGREALEEMFKESRELGSGLGGDFYKNAKQAREEFEHFEFAVSSLKERALAAVLPWIIKIGESLRDGAKQVIEFTKHTNVLKTGILFLAAGLAYKLIPALYSAAKALKLLKAEVLLPVIGVVLLYLAFDELWTTMQGGQSVLGIIIDKLFGVGTTAMLAKEHFKEMQFAGEAAFVGLLIAINPLLGAISAAALLIQMLLDKIEEAKYAGETDEQHKARMERENPKNRALFEKAQADKDKRDKETETKETAAKDKKKKAFAGTSEAKLLAAPLEGYREKEGLAVQARAAAQAKRDSERLQKEAMAHQAKLVKDREKFAASKEYKLLAGQVPGAASAYLAPIPGRPAAAQAPHVHNEHKSDVRITVNTDSNQPREIATTLDPVVRKALKDKYNTLTSRTAP